MIFKKFISYLLNVYMYMYIVVYIYILSMFLFCIKMFEFLEIDVFLMEN